MNSKVVDADGHVLEPANLWERNLPLNLRDRALKIRRDESGAEYLEIDGRKSRIVQGGSLGTFGTLDEDVRAHWKSTQSETGPSYEDHAPLTARDMTARLAWMDQEGIDVSLMYPSLGLCWQNECDDPALARAYCQVYNDWLTDLAAPYSDRIVPIAMIPLLSVEDGVAELRRAADLGARGLYLNPVPMNGVAYGDPSYDPIWAACAERGMPVAFHISNSPLHAGRQLYETNFGRNTWFLSMMYSVDCQIALASLFHGGVLERFPNLSVGVLEAGCGWIAHFVDRMDRSFAMGGHPIMRRPPRDYFDRQCWIAGDTDEVTFSAMVAQLGAGKFMWASDYPHEEGHAEPVKTLKQTLAGLEAADRDLILGGNAVAAYQLM
jgi:predicted TIM-barrel fold metal-dependent hydrolase